MDSESKKLLEETLALTEENNKMLHTMRRHMRMASVINLLYWVFIIGSAIGAYYVVEPYVTQAISVYNDANTKIDSLKRFGL